MQSPSKYSITPITAAVTAALYPALPAVAQEDGADNVLDEIIVTSRKRTESVQEIPATIQAISQEALASMGAKAMEDYSRFVPSVNVVTYGSGSSTVVFRGAITGPGYIGQATSSVYLDEISVTQTGSQPNIRAVDISRVEALSGPQGTLYGSDAQAGTMRIITNKPVMNTYEAIFDGEVRGGSEGDGSYRGSLVFNVPLVEDRLALRVAAYNDHDGGFIDNVPGRTADWHGLDGTNKAPAGWGTLDNSLSVEENWNDADYFGGRVHLRWEMNDSWATTFSYHHQSTEAGAGNSFDPFVGDLQTVRFHNNWRDETFDMGSLTVEGDLEFAQLTAAVSYFNRSVEGLSDITTYAHYWAAGYCHDTAYTQAQYPYYWANPATGYVLWWPRYCQGTTVEGDFFSSYSTLGAPTEDDKMTVELRLQSQGDTFDWIVGAYYEESKDAWKADFATPTLGGDGLTNMFQQSAAADYWNFFFAQYAAYWGDPISPTLDQATASWYSQSQTDWEQSAVFGEVTWHINDAWSMTVGGRYFERSNTNYYLVNHPGGFPDATGVPVGEPDIAVRSLREQRLGNGGLPFGREGQEEKFIPKISVSYSMSDNAMIYGLYTQGLRQGGVNRSRGVPFFPNTYETDTMDNYELGFKSTFGEGRGRFNVTAYNMAWIDYQLNLVDPASQPCINPVTGVEDPTLPPIDAVCGQPWQAIIANAGEAHIDGVNFELDYALNDNWLFGMNYEVMEAETDTQHDLNGDGIDDLVAGLRLPLVPSDKGSAWLEYSMPVDLFGGEEFFIRTQWSYTGDSKSVLEPRSQASEPNPQFHNPAYTVGDLRIGIIGEDWQVDLFLNNITDERAIYTTNDGQFEWGAAQTVEGRDHHQTVFTNRPREAGVRFMKRWGD